LWFTGVLLIFSLRYAGLVRTGLPHAIGSGEHAVGTVQARHVALITVAVAVGTFAVRLWLPAKGNLPGDLHLWEWPQCLGLPALGVIGARRGLREKAPDSLRRGGGRAVVVTSLTLPVVAVATGAHDVTGSLGPYLGGWSWRAVYAAVVESVLVVNDSLWLLGTAQRRFHTHGRVAAAVERSAYAPYILQGPVLLGLAVALRPSPVPALVKAVTVGGVGVVASFALGWLPHTAGPRAAGPGGTGTNAPAATSPTKHGANTARTRPAASVAHVVLARLLPATGYPRSLWPSGP
jgi:hypothetical protein